VIVALDATALITLLDREAAGPFDRIANARVERAQDRLAYLASRVGKSKGGRLIIPTPAFAEAAVRIDPATANRYLQIFERLKGFRVADFEKLAALEYAYMQRALLNEMPPKQRRSAIETKAKAKFDQQIVAISKVEHAIYLVTDDDGLARYAARFNLETKRVADLPLPEATDAQIPLDLDPPPDLPEED
jgi:hypothetical protein